MDHILDKIQDNIGDQLKHIPERISPTLSNVIKSNKLNDIMMMQQVYVHG